MTAGAGYSGTPLPRKLGITPATRLAALDAPADYALWLGEWPAGAALTTQVEPTSTLIHLFVTERAELAATLTRLRTQVGDEVPIWVSWPKRTAKVATTVTEDVIREVALPLGYVDVKVCAVSAVWSGLKLVVRRALRRPATAGAPPPPPSSRSRSRPTR